MKQAFSQGYIAIMTVLALLVFSLSLLVGLPYLSIGGAKQSLVLSQSESLLAALQGCAEDALILSVRDENYVGHSREYFGMHCDVAVEKNDTQWTLSVVGTKDDLTRTFVLSVDRTPGTPGILTLQSFLEQ